ncbi:MAG: hypothetical protein RJB14_2998 [Pseudomonadota bacterium]|jgi:hypothetical protein
MRKDFIYTKSIQQVNSPTRSLTPQLVAAQEDSVNHKVGRATGMTDS